MGRFWISGLLMGAALLASAFVFASGALAGGEPVPPITLSDEQIRQTLDLIDLNYPGMEKVRSAAGRGDWQAARRELGAYYRGRKSPQWPYAPTEWGILGTHLGSNAEQILRHEFIIYQKTAKLDPTINWAANPVGDREWTWGLNRHWQFGVLGDAYHRTKDEKYAREFADEITDWILKRSDRSNPVVLGESWRTIETGIRMFASWVPAWFCFADSPYFTDDVRLLMLKSFADHAGHLEKYPKGGNWLLMESNGLGHVGVFFPELKDAARWRKVAFERLSREIDHQAYPDGMQFELSSSYHQVSLFNFLQPLVLASVGKVDLPAGYLAGVRRMIAFNADLARPDGQLPMLNDSDETNLGALQSRVRQEIAHLSPELRSAIEKALPGNSADRSLLFPYAGLVVMRSGSDPDSRYLLMDAGPFGAGHQHEDKLSLEVYAYGQPLIVDPGRFSYTQEGGWFRSPRAHSAALVDGLGQNRAATRGKENTVMEPASGIRFESGEGFDFGEGVYATGFGPGNALKVTHTRKVLFVGPDYWIVSDHFAGSGRHAIQQLWHFSPGRAAVEGSMAVEYAGKSARLRLVPSHSDRVTAHVYMGQTEPFRGWYSPGYNLRVPAPEVEVGADLELPAALDTILFPSKVGKSPSLAVKALPVEADRAAVSSGAASAVEIRHAAGTDVALFTHAAILRPAIKRFGEFSTDAEIALVRRHSDGNMSRVALLNGSELTQGGQLLIHCASTAKKLEVAFTSQGIELSGDVTGEVRILAPSVTSIRFNGREIPSRVDGIYRVLNP